MTTTPDTRNYQLLATAILLVLGYFALRAALLLPRAMNVFADVGLELSASGQFLFNHHRWSLPILLLVWLVSMVSVWWRYRLHSLVVALGIVSLAIGSHLLTTGAMQPLLRMMEAMGES